MTTVKCGATQNENAEFKHHTSERNSMTVLPSSVGNSFRARPFH
jgi:hypothetical protein